MDWKRLGKYYEQADGFRVTACKVKEGWKFLLFDEDSLIGCFDSAEDAKSEAERYEILGNDGCFNWMANGRCFGKRILVNGAFNMRTVLCLVLIN